MNRVWHIEGYDGLDKIFEAVNLIPPCNLAPLLQCLVAKNGLSNEEIVGSFRKEKTLLKLPHLEVTKTDNRGSLSCGSNPHYHATARDA